MSEVVVSTLGGTNLQTASVGEGGSFTLNAVVEVPDPEYPVPKLPVIFYEGDKLVGQSVIGGAGQNGTLAQLMLERVAPGTHVYRAEYPQDKHYEYPVPLKFGPVTVTVAP